MNPLHVVVACAVLMPPLAQAGVFAEGYSSARPGGPADISYRVFTLYTRPEACAQAPVPAELRIHPDPLHLQVGDRIHRNNAEIHETELVIEAYDAGGRFLPAVPIGVGITETSGALQSYADWDYFEAVREGDEVLAVSWACQGRNDEPVVTEVPVIVKAGQGAGE